MISIDFFKPKEKTEEVIIEIEPVSCISVADKVNSSFVDCSKIVADNKIYGMLENVLGFTFSTSERLTIKNIIKTSKKYTEDHKKTIAYLPVIDDICEIVSIPQLEINNSFIDLSSNLFSAGDERHINGVRNSDFSVKNLTPEQQKKSMDKYPLFYTGTIKRKYVFVNPFQIKLRLTKELSTLLKEKIKVNSSAYLGNSDSIVNLKLISNEV